MEKVFYSNSGGMGIILNHSEFIRKHVFFEQSRIEYPDGSLFLIPGVESNLWGFWNVPMEYVGTLKSTSKNCLVFYAGEESTIFETKHYFYCVYLISPSRIFIKYNESSGRDYNYINGKWK